MIRFAFASPVVTRFGQRVTVMNVIHLYRNECVKSNSDEILMCPRELQ